LQHAEATRTRVSEADANATHLFFQAAEAIKGTCLVGWQSLVRKHHSCLNLLIGLWWMHQDPTNIRVSCEVSLFAQALGTCGGHYMFIIWPPLDKRIRMFLMIPKHPILCYPWRTSKWLQPWRLYMPILPNRPEG